MPPAPRAAAWKPVPRAGPKGLRTREEKSLRRSGRGEEVVFQQGQEQSEGFGRKGTRISREDRMKTFGRLKTKYLHSC